MKYKVGDKVMVRQDLKINQQYGADIYTSFMSSSFITIKEIITVYNYDRSCVLGDAYKIKEDNYNYTDEMLEGLVENVPYERPGVCLFGLGISLEHKCTCSSSDLFNYGCKCGGK